MKKEFKRPGNYIRYISKKDGESDSHYNYEATQLDLEFLQSASGSGFDAGELELLFNTFEKESWLLSNPSHMDPITFTKAHKTDAAVAEEVKPFQTFVGVISRLGLRQPTEETERLYNVRNRYRP